MGIITRYILRRLIIGTVFASAGLVCILWLSQSLRFIELIVRKGLSILVFTRLMLLLLPNFIVIILPIALFAVTLFLYNRLITDRELTALRAAGMSSIQLSVPALLLAIGITALCFSLTLYAVPKTIERFREMQFAVRNDASTVFLQDGTFTEVANGLTVYIRSRSHGGDLLGILIHNERDPHNTITVIAERGALISTENELRILMVNGSQQEVRGDKERLSILYFDSYTMSLGRLDEVEHTRFRDARERSIQELLTMSEDAGLSTVEVRRFRIEAHQRFAMPLFNISFVIIALTFLLQAPFNRRGQTLRVIAAVGTMITVEAIAMGIINLATRHLCVAPLLYVVALFPVGVALYILWFASKAVPFKEIG